MNALLCSLGVSKRLIQWGAGVAAGMVFSVSAQAQFQEIIPDQAILQDVLQRHLHLDIRFTHPMDMGPVLPMDYPEEVGVIANGRRTILTDKLQTNTEDGAQTFGLDYEVKAPGDHIFYIVPAPYWDPSEQKMISQYAKVIVDAYGAGNGWDVLVGMPMEIQPLSRPYALWAGNVFQGVVLRHGEPVPYAELSVAYHNDGSVIPPADSYSEQIIRADINGTFTYGIPKAGWWGFAAAAMANDPLKNPEGEAVNHEETGVIWVHALDIHKAH
ncbi:DUF4198 domain-containing protein [Pokkaliibacter plantistimulans]|nr:DUF4198 domain-containing protein [Pokkaliibacter plantistimulans]